MHKWVTILLVSQVLFTSCDNILPLGVVLTATVEGNDENGNAVEPAVITLEHTSESSDYWALSLNVISNDFVLDNHETLAPLHRVEHQTAVRLDITKPDGASDIPFQESYYLFNSWLAVPGPTSDSTIAPLYDQFTLDNGRIRGYLGHLIFQRMTPQGADLPLTTTFTNFPSATLRRPGMLGLARVEQDDMQIGFNDEPDSRGMRSVLSQLFRDLLGAVPGLVASETIAISRVGDAGLYFTPMTRPSVGRNRSISFVFKFTVRAPRQILLPVDHLVDIYMQVRYDVIQNPPDNGGLLVGLSPFCLTTFCSNTASIMAVSRRAPDCIGPDAVCVGQEDADDILAIVEDNIEDISIDERRDMNESSFILANAIRSRSNNQFQPLPFTEPEPAVSPYDFLLMPEGTPSSVSNKWFSTRVMPLEDGIPIKMVVLRN